MAIQLPFAHPAFSLDLTTPAVIMSAVSLLLLAYTNRFLTATVRTRQLVSEFQQHPTEGLLAQIQHQRKRLQLIRDMQTVAVACLFTTVLTIFLVYNGYQLIAEWTFWLALILMLVSLVISTQDIYLSLRSLDIHLDELATEAHLSEPLMPERQRARAHAAIEHIRLHADDQGNH